MSQGTELVSLIKSINGGESSGFFIDFNANALII